MLHALLDVMDVVVDHRQGDAHRQDGHSGERNCGIADEAVRLDLRVDVHPVRLIRLQRKTTRGMTGQTDPFIWWERSRMLGEKSAESEKRLSNSKKNGEKTEGTTAKDSSFFPPRREGEKA